MRVYGETKATQEEMERYGALPAFAKDEHFTIWSLHLGAWGLDSVDLRTTDRQDRSTLTLRFGGNDTLDLMKLREGDIAALREFLNDVLDLATRHARADDTIELERLREEPDINSRMLKAAPKRTENDYMLARVKTNRLRDGGKKSAKSRFRNIETIEQVESTIAERRRAQREAWEAMNTTE